MDVLDTLGEKRKGNIVSGVQNLLQIIDKNMFFVIPVVLPCYLLHFRCCNFLKSDAVWILGDTTSLVQTGILSIMASHDLCFIWNVTCGAHFLH